MAIGKRISKDEFLKLQRGEEKPKVFLILLSVKLEFPFMLLGCFLVLYFNHLVYF